MIDYEAAYKGLVERLTDDREGFAAQDNALAADKARYLERLILELKFFGIAPKNG